MALLKYYRPNNAMKEPVNSMSVRNPDGFPDIPVYPQAVLVDSVKDEQSQGGPFYTVHWTADAQVAEVMSWYANKLTESGWSVFVALGDPQSAIQFSEFRKGDLYLQLSVVKKQDQQSVSIETILHPTPTEEGEEEEGK